MGGRHIACKASVSQSVGDNPIQYLWATGRRVGSESVDWIGLVYICRCSAFPLIDTGSGTCRLKGWGRGFLVGNQEIRRNY